MGDVTKRSKLEIAKSPAGLEGPGFFVTKLEDAVGLARKNSLWPLPFATSCCGIEFMATMASNYDLGRFGAERLSFSPRQADMLMVMGTIAKKMGPILRQVYEQMAEPRWVLSVGACASSGGIFDTYSVLQGIDRIIPVDVYVPGCPPRPEQIIDGILKIQELTQNESFRRRNSPEYKKMLNSYGIE
jgi:NADH-quinone oxidoreductase subunit B